MELKPGYKQTEVGVIPDDWETLSVFDIAERQKARFDDGDWVEAEHITDKGVRLVQTGNIGIGNYVEKEKKKYIYNASFDLLRCKPLEVGDLLICRLAEPAGRACILPNIGDEKVITSVDVTIFRPDAGRFDRGYLVQYFSTSAWFDSILERVGGTTHKRISRSALGSIQIPIPIDKVEQSAIAAALGDMDALLAAQDALIEKKRAIKQGAMQDLLTGKRRLPGFGGELAIRRLGELCSLKSGVGITAERINQYSEYPCYGGNGLRGYTNVFTHEGDYALIGRQGALCGNVVGASGRFFASEHALVVTPKPTTYIHWLEFVLIEANLNQFSESSAQPGLSATKLLALEFNTPLMKEEQVAIADALSSMDMDIAAQEAKREKIAQLKQGMMQSLLTGRVRLV